MKVVCGVTLTTWNFCWTPSTSNLVCYFVSGSKIGWVPGTMVLGKWSLGWEMSSFYLVGDSFICTWIGGSILDDMVFNCCDPIPTMRDGVDWCDL